jgi:hypothetical protein
MNTAAVANTTLVLRDMNSEMEHVIGGVCQEGKSGLSSERSWGSSFWWQLRGSCGTGQGHGSLVS